MAYNFTQFDINDKEAIEKNLQKINFNKLDKNVDYDISIEFFNKDLKENISGMDAFFEIKKEHYQFVKIVRNIFENKKIKINRFNLMGTIIELYEDEAKLTIKKSLDRYKSNNIYPSKEIIIYEDTKNKLDKLLDSNLITEEEYELQLDDLRSQLSIYEFCEESGYVN